MTAVMEPPPIVGADLLALTANSMFREMTFNEALFEATRPTDPAWCDGDCETNGHFGTAVLHYSNPDSVPASIDPWSDRQENLEVRAGRHDDLTDGSQGIVEVADPTGMLAKDDRVYLTPKHARQFAKLLIDAADRAELDFETPAEQVRIGDWIRSADGQWIEVYLVCADKASDSVQIAGCTDIEDRSDFDHRDENPEFFKPGEMVRVHRGGDPR